MKLSTFLTIASLLALGAVTTTSQAFAAAGNSEKCAGVAKAGKNDCGTSVSSCAATSITGLASPGAAARCAKPLN